MLRLRAAAHRPAGHDLLQKGGAAAYRAYSYMYMAQAAQTNDLQHVLRISYFLIMIDPFPDLTLPDPDACLAELACPLQLSLPYGVM